MNLLKQSLLGWWRKRNRPLGRIHLELSVGIADDGGLDVEILRGISPVCLRWLWNGGWVWPYILFRWPASGEFFKDWEVGHHA